MIYSKKNVCYYYPEGLMREIERIEGGSWLNEWPLVCWCSCCAADDSAGWLVGFIYRSFEDEEPTALWSILCIIYVLCLVEQVNLHNIRDRYTALIPRIGLFYKYIYIYFFKSQKLISRKLKSEYSISNPCLYTNTINLDSWNYINIDLICKIFNMHLRDH